MSHKNDSRNYPLLVLAFLLISLFAIWSLVLVQ